ncbi:uncharacterized protein [Palaemon carinicauda]
MALVYFNMFWPNIALWIVIGAFYLIYLSAWIIDQCMSCCRKSKITVGRCPHAIEAASHGVSTEELPLGVYCPHHSPSCCALNGCRGLPFGEYTLRLQPDQDTGATQASSFDSNYRANR